MDSGENLAQAQEAPLGFPCPRETSASGSAARPNPIYLHWSPSLPLNTNSTGIIPKQSFLSHQTFPGPHTSLRIPNPLLPQKVPSISHLGVFVSGAGAGPAGAGPEGESSGLWAGARSSTSSASMGSRRGTSLSTGSDVGELKATGPEATAGVCGGA